MRDKTLDDRFFILTLFAVAMEAEKQMLNAKDTLLQVALPVGRRKGKLCAYSGI